MAVPTMAFTIYLTDEEIEKIKEKFNIKSNEDVRRAIYECISTYLEM